MKNSSEIVVIGPGAVGGICAGILHEKGYNVNLVGRNSNIAMYINENGLKISGFCGSMNSFVPTVADIKLLKKKADLILIATKAGDLSSVAKSLNPILKNETLVVSLQNGIVEEELASIVGIERTVGCVVGWGATLKSEGNLEMTSKGEFIIGYLNKKADNRLYELKQILATILPTECSDEILNQLYSKLIINSCISTLGALSGLFLGEMLKKKNYRTIFLSIIREAIAVADAMEIKIPPFSGKLDYYKLLSWNKTRQNLYLRAFGFKYRKLKSSSLQSLERGKKTEVNNFNGYISMKGIQHQVKTPVNSRLTAMIMEIESGNRKSNDKNISDLL